MGARGALTRSIELLRWLALANSVFRDNREPKVLTSLETGEVTRQFRSLRNAGPDEISVLLPIRDSHDVAAYLESTVEERRDPGGDKVRASLRDSEITWCRGGLR